MGDCGAASDVGGTPSATRQEFNTPVVMRQGRKGARLQLCDPPAWLASLPTHVREQFSGLHRSPGLPRSFLTTCFPCALLP